MLDLVARNPKHDLSIQMHSMTREQKMEYMYKATRALTDSYKSYYGKDADNTAIHYWTKYFNATKVLFSLDDNGSRF